jgi:predicted metalloprotease with PDZ domain
LNARAASVALALIFSFSAAGSLSAQPSPGPQPYPMPPPIPAPRDTAYPGMLTLDVDVTDTEQRIMSVRETIPVGAPGPFTLLYPGWLPGDHARRGPLEKIAGLVFRANGKVIPWTRDAVSVFAFHLDVPAGVSTVEAEFQFLSPTDPDQGRVVVTPEMLNLQWNEVALYPAGYFTRRIEIQASAHYPQGWGSGTALDVEASQGGSVRYKPVSFETLIDSPVFAGRYFRRFDLDPGAGAPVHLDVVADRPDLLDAPSSAIERHRDLVRQAYRLFGSTHYDHYDLLLALSSRLGGIGLEHHRSSENGTATDYFTGWTHGASLRDLLPHEFVHSWNGKFRRPADLWTPDYETPMRGSLLWVYEGLTQYWGFVLGARSGLLTRADALDALAIAAAAFDAREGRQWRSLADTQGDPIINARRPQPWSSWQRSEDYYDEGLLIWLDVDTLIRARSAGRRSLDDFAKLFFGMDDGSWADKPYTFDDIVAALNQVEQYDWAGFLHARVDATPTNAPLDGLNRGGWRLIYDDAPTEYFRSIEIHRKMTDLTYSLGLVANADGEIIAVRWQGPAFKSGLTAGAKILAVNGISYDSERLRRAITDAKTGQPVSLIVKTADHFRTVSLDYHGGLRYPRLERIPKTPDLLSAAYSPRS